MNYKEFIGEWESESDMITAHTSGSTGTPKQILLSREMVMKSAMRTIEFFGIDSTWRLHSCISPDTIGGKMVAVRAMTADCQFTFEDPSNRPEIAYAEKIADMVSVVPSQMRHILDHAEDMGYRGRIFLIGGSPVPDAMAREIARSGLDCYESYGMTETASHIAVRRISEDKKPFKPLPGVRISLDHRQCLVIDGVADQRIITNDIAEIHPDGTFTILGRYDNVIITGGKKVNPEQLESKIRKILDDSGYSDLYTDLMVTSRPDEKWGERIVLRMESPEAMDNRTIDSIMKILRSRLEGWECPKETECAAILPRTANGKIYRGRNTPEHCF